MQAEQAVRLANLDLEKRVQERTWELRQTNDQLAQEVRERQATEVSLRRYTEQLKRSNADLERFAFAASHDLQEPLRMVANYVGLLRFRYVGKVIDAQAEEYIKYAESGAVRMRNLIESILEYSRVSRQTPQKEQVDLNGLVHDVLETLQTTIDERKVRIEKTELPTLETDAALVTQVFQNLIGNAIKFSPKDPVVTITAKNLEEGWVFSVQDNGIGIDPAFSDDVFTMFRRLHRREQYPGNGIGLAVARRIVELLDGRIWLESVPDQGTTFFFTLEEAKASEKG